MKKPKNHANPTRRQFLAHTAAAAGAASLVGCASTRSTRSRAAQEGPMPVARARVPLADGEPIRMALVGCGGMGNGHLDAFMGFNERKEEAVHIVAVADCCSLKVDEAVAKCSRKQGFAVDGAADYRALLARDDIHAVLIASPEHWHGEMCRDAIAAGKDTYLEKPMTLRLDDGLHLRRVHMANPEVIVQIGTQKMTLPKYNEAQRLVAEGAIGHPTFSQTSYCRNSKDGEWLYYGIRPEIQPGSTIDWDAWCGHLGPRPWDPALYARWRRYKDFSTGIVGDLLVHEVTPLMMALQCGYPTRVVATGGHYIDKAMENHDQVNLQVQFGKKDHTMIVAGSTCNDQGLETMIRGHKATMYLGSNNVVIRPQQLFIEEVEEQTVECPNIGNDQDQLRLNWLHCIRTREAPKSPVEFATQVIVAVDLATRSMWEGKAFGFDEDTMTAHAM
ncbi:MAG: Gfo/Idh/MocA family protein [Phycisphaerales bacterium]